MLCDSGQTAQHRAQHPGKMPAKRLTTERHGKLKEELLIHSSAVHKGVADSLLAPASVGRISSDAVQAVVHEGLTSLLRRPPAPLRSWADRGGELQALDGHSADKTSRPWLEDRLRTWLGENERLRFIPTAASPRRTSWPRFWRSSTSAYYASPAAAAPSVPPVMTWGECSILIKQLYGHHDHAAAPMSNEGSTQGPDPAPSDAVQAAMAELDRRVALAGLTPAENLCLTTKEAMLNRALFAWLSIIEGRDNNASVQGYWDLHEAMSALNGLLVAGISPSSQYFDDQVTAITNNEQLMQQCPGAKTELQAMKESLRVFANLGDARHKYGLTPVGDCVVCVLEPPQEPQRVELPPSSLLVYATVVASRCEGQGGGMEAVQKQLRSKICLEYCRLRPNPLAMMLIAGPAHGSAHSVLIKILQENGYAIDAVRINSIATAALQELMVAPN